MIISIDGPAGSGKSTVAEILAIKLGFVHFNSGSLYRAITAYALKNQIDIETSINALSKLNLEVCYKNNVQHVFVNKIDFTNDLRDNAVSALSPITSKFKEIRNLVDDCQRQFAYHNNVVIDGRDIGSYVFPNAEHKFYLDCSVDIRAERRFKEEQQKGSKITLEEIKQQIIDRDNFDKNKKIAPLVVPNGAHIIDSAQKTAEQVANEMYNIIKKI